MQLDLTPDQMAQLARMADHKGKNVEQFAKEIVVDSIEESERFNAAVREGIAQADRGEFIEHDEVVKRINGLFRK